MFKSNAFGIFKQRTREVFWQMEFRILYEDAHVISAVKPAGLCSEDAPGEESFPRLLRQEAGIQALFPVHRLDKAVGGAMVYAKTKQAAAALGAAVQNGSFQKLYRAAVHGSPPEAGEWEDLLFYDRRQRKTFPVKRMRQGVKPAKLAFTRVASAQTAAGTLTLMEVRLFTGRTHQIRAQFASRGFSLAGDRRYGAADSFGAPALFCVSLTFPHPATGEPVRVQACPPDREPWKLFNSAEIEEQ